MASEKQGQPSTIEAFDERGLEAIQGNFETLFANITSGFTLSSEDVLGVLPVASGGTGITSIAVGDLLYGSAVNTISALTIGAAGKVLRSNGILPVYSTFTIADTFASGRIVRASAANTLAQSGWTIQAAFGTGGMIYASATDTLVQLDIGSAGQVIRSTGTIPAYSTFTIPNTFATGSIVHASAANVLTALAVGAAGTILVGGATVPSYTAAPTITTSVTVPLVIGGTAVGSTLTLKSTTGVGTTDAIIFQVGNNGATEALRIVNAGNVGIGATTGPTSGTATLFFGDGTIPATLASNTAAIYADDVGGTVEMFGINEAGLTNQLTGLAIRKAADETVTNSTTHQADDELTVNLAASSSYHFEIHGHWTTAGATAGITLQLDGTVGVGSLKADITIYDHTLNTMSALARVTAFNSAVGVNGTGDNSFLIKGTIETTTAGTFFLEWAQNTADAVNGTLVQENSMLMLRKLNA